MLAKDQAIIVALDRSVSKVDRIVSLADRMELKNIHTYVMDATKCFEEPEVGECVWNPIISQVSAETRRSIKRLPKCAFDKILLDGPCSALGKK